MEQQNLAAVMARLAPLVTLASSKSCAEATLVLVGVLKEALDEREATSKRAEELKELNAEDLVLLFTPKNGTSLDHEKKRSAFTPHQRL